MIKLCMKVLILTVGTTPGPLEEALAHHAPEGVVFLASQDTHPVAAKLVRDYGTSLRHHASFLDWSESFAASYHVTLKNPKTFLKQKRLAPVAYLKASTRASEASATV